MAGITLFCAFFGWFFKSLTQVIEVPEEEEDSKTQQQPLLQRIKAARAQEWTQSDENLNHHQGKQQLVESTTSNGTATANGSVLPLSDVLNIIPLNDTAGDVAKMSSSKSSGIAGGKSSLAIENTASNLLSSRGRTRSERRNTLTTRDEMMYSNLSLVVPPPNRSISSLNLAQGESGAAGAEAGIILSGNSVIDDYLNKGWTLVDEPRGFLAGFNLLLLKRPSFILLSISGFLCLVGFFIPFIYISDRAKLLGRIDKTLLCTQFVFRIITFPFSFHLLGCSPEQCAFILSSIGIANTFGRVFCGWASDNPRVNALVMNNLALTVGGVATILSPIIFNTYYTLIVYAAIFGFSVGKNTM